MHELAIYDANVVIDWHKLRELGAKPPLLKEFYTHNVLTGGDVKLLMTPSWFGDAASGFAGAKDDKDEGWRLNETTLVEFMYAVKELSQSFADDDRPVTNRIFREHIVFSVPEDPKDNHLATTAIAAQVRYLVTSDNDLLVLRFDRRFLNQAPNTLILKPDEFETIHRLRHDSDRQHRRYIEVLSDYLEKRESLPQKFVKDGRQRNRPSELFREPAGSLKKMFLQHWEAKLSRPDAGKMIVQHRKRRGGGSGGEGEGGGGSPPTGSGSPPPTMTPSRQGRSRMLSIAEMPGGRDYLEYLLAEYYLDQSQPSVWMGRGATALGLSGTVSADAFHNLAWGFDQNARPLVQNAGKVDGPQKHKPGLDLTFSAPKDVSVMWAVVSDENRKRIEQCHEKAVREAIDYLEREAGQSRQYVNGNMEVVPAKLVVAAVQHGVSRSLDPQLHTHCVVFNVGVREDGSTGSLHNHKLFTHKMAAGALYQATLAASLKRELGLELTAAKHGFDVVGVPKRLSHEFSKRREEILQKLGGPTASAETYSAKAAADVARETRQVKQKVAVTDLFSEWKRIASTDEFRFAQKEADALIHEKPRHVKLEQEKVLRQAFDTAAEKVLDQKSFFPKRELIREAARTVPVGSATAKELQRGLEDWLKKPEIVSLGNKQSEQQLTTQAVIERERDLLQKAKERVESHEHPVKERVRTKILERFATVGVSDDDRQRNEGQRKAVEHLTGPESLTILTGWPGTGKSTVLKSCREIWERSGYQVFGTAIAGRAAEELKHSSGIQSENLARRLTMWENASSGHSWGHGLPVFNLRPRKSLFERKHQQPEHKLGPKSIVVVDEAGMVGTADFHRLVCQVAKAKAKLVIVGDKDQLQPINAGGVLAEFEKRFGRAVITHITRQQLDPLDNTPEWRREAVRLFQKQDAAKAIQLFSERGFTTVADDQEKTREKLVKDWAKNKGHEHPREHLILAAIKEDVRAINALCQRQRLLADRNANPFECVEHNSEKFYRGDRVLFKQRDVSLCVENGHFGTVEKITGMGKLKTLHVRHDDGRLVPVRLDRYEDLRLGYAVTTHVAQGMTTSYAYVLLGGPMQDMHLSYVQASRAKFDTRFYVNEREGGPFLQVIAQAMAQPRYKEMAVSMVPDRQPQQSGQFWEQQR